MHPKVEKAVSAPLGTDNRKAKPTKMWQMKCKTFSEGQTGTDMRGGETVGAEGEEGTAGSPGTNRADGRSTYNRKQRNFTCSVVLMHQQNEETHRWRRTM